MVRNLLVVAALAASFIAVPGSAYADHNTCGSGHLFQYAAGPEEASTGTVDTVDTKDFWHDTPGIAGSETLREIVLLPLTGDADLYVWKANCSAVICSSAAATGPDSCLVDASGDTYVEVRHFSGSAQYVVSVTFSPLFIH